VLIAQFDEMLKRNRPDVKEAKHNLNLQTSGPALEIGDSNA